MSDNTLKDVLSSLNKEAQAMIKQCIKDIDINRLNIMSSLYADTMQSYRTNGKESNRSITTMGLKLNRNILILRNRAKAWIKQEYIQKVEQIAKTQEELDSLLQFEEVCICKARCEQSVCQSTDSCTDTESDTTISVVANNIDHTSPNEDDFLQQATNRNFLPYSNAIERMANSDYYTAMERRSVSQVADKSCCLPPFQTLVQNSISHGYFTQSY